jgi:hypothetical protein
LRGLLAWAKVSVVHSGPRLTALSATAAAALLLGAAGCTSLDQASAAGMAHDDLLSEMSIQLARVTGLTYSATYQLTGGDTATVTQAQKPTRTAYVYPRGRLIQTPTGTVRCIGDQTGGEARGKAGGEARGKATVCTETDPAPATTAPLAGSALITPEAALAMLNTAALDREVDATQHDTTIAGRHAICLDLDNVDGIPARRFSLCVTNEGALGSFAATIAGTYYEQALTTYGEKVAPDAFDLPPAAKLTDRRGK